MAKKASMKKIITSWEARTQNKLEVNPSNKVVICGWVDENLQYSHRKPNTREKYYRTRIVNFQRTSINFVPILIHENIITKKEIRGKWMEVIGMMVSHNGKLENGKTYLAESVLVLDYNLYDQENEMLVNSYENQVYLQGNLCEDAFSMTGGKVDFMLAVNTKCSKVAYIPCIALGEEEKKIAIKLKKGERIGLYGKFQCRHFDKKLPNGKKEKRISYEIIARRIDLLG